MQHKGERVAVLPQLHSFDQPASAAQQWSGPDAPVETQLHIFCQHISCQALA